MDRIGSWASALLLVGTAGWAAAQSPALPASEPPAPNEILWVVQPPGTNSQTTPPVTPPPAAQATTNSNDPNNRPPRLSLSSRANWKAPMMGDFPGYYTVGTLSATTLLTPRNADVLPGLPGQNGGPVASITTQQRVAAPLLTRAGVKVSENESPLPQDRFYAAYNFYYRIPVPVLDQRTFGTNFFPGTNNPNGNFNATPASDILVSPMAGHVLTAGFESSFLDGRASLGIRIPFYFTNQTYAAVPNQALLDAQFGPNFFVGTAGNTSDGLGGSAVGDLSVLFKFALYKNEDTGNLFTVGLAVTAPTGRVTGPVNAASPNDALLQPFVGYVLNAGSFYVHAFHGVLVPTNANDLTLLTNDVGFGYRIALRDDGAGLQAIIPTVEAHVTTPLNHRDNAGPFLFNDLVVLTGGAHFVIGNGPVLTFGAAVPVTGPRPFQVEAQARLNWYY